MKLNLNLYDSVLPKYKTWINAKLKVLYSRVITYRNYFTILKKYDNKRSETNYYLVCSDERDDENQWSIVCKKSDSVIKMPLNNFWRHINVSNLNSDITEINIEVVDKADNAEIYYLDI